MSRQAFYTALLALLASTISAAEKPTLLEARKIWDRGAHNAFTDLVRHRGRWYCVFREAKGHVSPDGKIRVLTSSDGTKWTSAALLTRAKSDLRDPASGRPSRTCFLLWSSAAIVRASSSLYLQVVHPDAVCRNKFRLRACLPRN